MDYKNLEMLSWLVAQFRRAGETGITFDQLIDKLVDEPNMEKILPKRTFHNYLKELRDRFGIKIECDSRLQHEVGKKALSEERSYAAVSPTTMTAGAVILSAFPAISASVPRTVFCFVVPPSEMTAAGVSGDIPLPTSPSAMSRSFANPIRNTIVPSSPA